MGLERVQLVHPSELFLFNIVQNSELEIPVENIRVCQAVVDMQMQSQRVQVTACVKLGKFITWYFFQNLGVACLCPVIDDRLIHT